MSPSSVVSWTAAIERDIEQLLEPDSTPGRGRPGAGSRRAAGCPASPARAAARTPTGCPPPAPAAACARVVSACRSVASAMATSRFAERGVVVGLGHVEQLLRRAEVSPSSRAAEAGLGALRLATQPATGEQRSGTPRGRTGRCSPGRTAGCGRRRRDRTRWRIRPRSPARRAARRRRGGVGHEAVALAGRLARGRSRPHPRSTENWLRSARW